jgi:hypothetical protein
LLCDENRASNEASTNDEMNIKDEMEDSIIGIERKVPLFLLWRKRRR